MAQPTNTYDAYDAGDSNREDLADIIYNIAPTETPALNMMRRGTAANKRHEWLTDTLETSASNRQVEGDDYVAESRQKPDRLHSFTQISAKSLTVSGTQEVIDKAGRKSEIAYLLSLQAKELKRDIERHICGFANAADAAALAGVVSGGTFPNSAGSSSGARVTANLGTWINTNIDEGGTGLGPAFAAGQPADDDSRDPGTPRAMTESMVKSVIKDCWNEGGNPEYIIADPEGTIGEAVSTHGLPLKFMTQFMKTMVKADFVLIGCQPALTGLFEEPSGLIQERAERLARLLVEILNGGGND